MIHQKKIIVVLPAYNAEKTLEQTIGEIPEGLVDELILVDDASRDATVDTARRLPIHHVIRHERNRGYGANQKTCYDTALRLGADIVVMLHPDYQYTPKLIAAMVHLIADGVYPVVIGSRILGKGALRGGMPRYKYFFNRILTLIQNLLMNEKLSEYHTGYRAFSREVLETINYPANSDDFVFDNQMLAQILCHGFPIGEISCPTHYFPEASSISFVRSLRYGRGVLVTTLMYMIHKTRIISFPIFRKRK